MHPMAKIMKLGRGQNNDQEIFFQLRQYNVLIAKSFPAEMYYKPRLEYNVEIILQNIQAGNPKTGIAFTQCKYLRNMNLQLPEV